MSHGPLLERESELATLEECLASAREGEGRFVFIAGEAGLGKSSLIGEFCARHAGTARVLWGQCDPLETPRPLGPVLDIARSAGGGLATLADGADRHRLFSAFVDSCRGTDTPTVAVIEDLHWADAATLDFIAYTGRRLELRALPARRHPSPGRAQYPAHRGPG